MSLTETPGAAIGSKAPEFDLPDASGQHHSLRSCMGDNGLMVAFICNHCPYVQAIAGRLAADARTLQESGINSVAIMSNDYANYPDDSPEQMLRFAAAHDFRFPYLVDESQEVARAFGAVCTPDLFGLDRSGRLQYRGRLDDARNDANPDQRTPELVNAMLQIAETGATTATQYPSMGCSIKWRG